MSVRMQGRLVFRGGYRARVWIGALLLMASWSLVVFGALVVLIPKAATVLLVPLGAAVLAGLVHLFRPRTVIDLDTGQVRAGRENLTIRDFDAVAFETSITTFRETSGTSEVAVYSAVLRAGARERALLRSSDPRQPWALSRRLAGKLQLPWVLVEGATTTCEVPPEALDRLLAVGLPPKELPTPAGATVEEGARHTRIRLPAFKPSLVLLAALVPGTLGGMGLLTIPPSFTALRWFVLGLSVAMFLGMVALLPTQVRAVVIDDAGIHLEPGLGASVLVPWPALVSLQVGPKGRPLLVGSGDGLRVGRSPHAAWVLSAILVRLRGRALPRAAPRR